MGRVADVAKLAEWRKRVARQRASGLTVAEFCRRERVKLCRWKYWRSRVEGVLRPKAAEPALRPKAAAFQAVEIIPRRFVLVRFPGGTTLEIPDDRVDLVRLAIDRMAALPETEPC